MFALSKRDTKCLFDPRFHKFLFKHSPLFPLFNYELSRDDENFSLTSCLEISKYIEDISYSDESELVRLFKCVAPVFHLVDNIQVPRLEILLGFPQIIVGDSNFSKYPFPVFGYNKIIDYDTKYIEYRCLYNLRNTSCFLKKISKAKEKVQIELFLEMLKVCVENKSLYAYLKSIPSEDLQHSEYFNL